MDNETLERLDEIRERNIESPSEDVQFLLDLVDNLDSQLDAAHQMLVDEGIIE